MSNITSANVQDMLEDRMARTGEDGRIAAWMLVCKWLEQHGMKYDEELTGIESIIYFLETY